MGRRAKPFGKEGEKSDAIFFHPSLDAPRTHQILTHKPRRREATGYESGSSRGEGVLPSINYLLE